MADTLSSRSRFLPVMALTAVCLALFINTLPNELVWDDTIVIINNRYIRDYKNIPRFLTPRYWNESRLSPGLYRPVREITLAADYYLWGRNPAGYRVTNILLHVISVLLVFFLAALVAQKGGAREAAAGRGSLGGAAFLTALFFAAHPMHIESVNVVKNRSDLLAMIFFLTSCLLFVRHLSAAGRTGRWLLAGSCFCFIPAALSKEMALSLPGVLVLYAGCFLSGAQRRKALLRVIPFGVMILGYFWFMHAFIRPGDPLPPNALLPAGAGQRVLTVMKTLGDYARLLLVPFPLSLDHPFPIPGSLLEPGVLTCLLLLLPAGGIAVRSFRGDRIALFAVGWIGLTLIPAANIVYLVSRPVAEQRLYIPSLGFCLLLGYGVRRLASIGCGRLNRSRAAVIGAVLFSLYAVVTVQRNREWRHPLDFYARELTVNPFSARMHNNLGVALSESGRYDEAAGHYLTALRLDPYYVRAYNNLGLITADRGRPDEAVDYFKRALSLNPDYVEAHINLGAVLAEEGRLEEAIRHYRIGLELQPDSGWAHHNLAMAFSRTGKTEEALDHFLTAIRLDPDYTEAYINLGATLAAAGRSDEAMGCYEKALRLDPDHITAHNNLGVELIRQGRWDDAIRHFMSAVTLDPDYADAHMNLGATLVAAGRPEEAIRHYEIAVRLDADSADARNRLGAELLKMGRPEEAIPQFFDALRLQPDHAQTLNNLGLALTATGQVAEAAGYFETALKLMPDSADICCNLGRARLIQGDRRGAAALLSRALKLDPGHEKAQQAYRECLGKAE